MEPERGAGLRTPSEVTGAVIVGEPGKGGVRLTRGGTGRGRRCKPGAAYKQQAQHDPQDSLHGGKVAPGLSREKREHTDTRRPSGMISGHESVWRSGFRLAP